MTDNGIIEVFRNDPLFCHSRNLLSGIQVFKDCGPRLKDCRGDEKGNRSIQGQAKNGSKVAGVTKKIGKKRGKEESKLRRQPLKKPRSPGAFF